MIKAMMHASESKPLADTWSETVDAQFFTLEVEAMFDDLYRLSYSILRSKPDAQDAVQQGLLKAWAAKARANPATFRAWLARIVINESRNTQRYRMRVTPVSDVRISVSVSPSEGDVMDAVYSLPEKLRVPFSLKYITGFKEREVAGILHLPVSTIKNRLARARTLLREALTDEEVSFE